MGSIEVGLIEQQQPCAGCESDDERFTLLIHKNTTDVDELCRACASSLFHKLQKILRDIPAI